MNKQNAILKSQTIIDTFEVIGQGGMIYEPCQIGEWWVMPADQYTGTIPLDIIQKWDDFKALNIPVVGYLIADDMRDVLIRRELEAEKQREQERKELERLEMELKQQAFDRQQQAERLQREAELKRRRENAERAAKEAAVMGTAIITGIGVALGAVVTGAAMLTIGIIGALLRFDPILIAVLPDGRWICLGAWWD